MIKTFPPMLANSIDANDLPEFVFNDKFFFEQKLDGHRIILFYDAHTLLACERYGKASQHNPKFQAPAWDDFRKHVNFEVVLDGEYIDNVLYIFDMPVCNANGMLTTTQSPYAHRRANLHTLFNYEFASLDVPMKLVPTATDPQAKALLAARCLRNNAEGVMVKMASGQYQPGKRSDNCLKAKFVKTADCIVKQVGRDMKENAVLEVWRGHKKVEVGSCSMLGKGQVKRGDVVEVRYLYLGANEKLVQPNFLMRRKDKKATDCKFDQLVPTNKEVLLAT